MTSLEKQIERIEIGSVVFYADTEIASRLIQLVESAQRSSLKCIDEQEWSEIAAELLLERLQNASSGYQLTADDLDYLAKYLNLQLGSATTSNCGGGRVAGLINPLSLGSTFLL